MLNRTSIVSAEQFVKITCKILAVNRGICYFATSLELAPDAEIVAKHVLTLSKGSR